MDKYIKLIKDLRHEVEKLDERLDKFSTRQGAFLNRNYTELMYDVKNTIERAEEYGEYIPQKLQGLTRKIKNIKGHKYVEYFDTYDIYEDKIIHNIIGIADQPYDHDIRLSLDYVSNEIENNKPSPTHNYEPNYDDNELTFTNSVLERVRTILNKYSTTDSKTSWRELSDKIIELINKYGDDVVADMFERNAQEYGTADDINYAEAKSLLGMITEWDSYGVDFDLETNKNITEGLDYYESTEE